MPNVKIAMETLHAPVILDTLEMEIVAVCELRILAMYHVFIYSL